MIISRGRFVIGLLLGIVLTGSVAYSAILLNTPQNGYLLCVNQKTKVVTYPATQKCPAGTSRLILGAQGLKGEQGLPGKDGIDGKNGSDGKDGIVGVSGIGATPPTPTPTPTTPTPTPPTPTPPNPTPPNPTPPTPTPPTPTPVNGLMQITGDQCSGGWSFLSDQTCQMSFSAGQKFTFTGFNNAQGGNGDLRIYVGECVNDSGNFRYTVIAGLPSFIAYSGDANYCIRFRSQLVTTSWMSYTLG